MCGILATHRKNYKIKEGPRDIHNVTTEPKMSSALCMTQYPLSSSSIGTHTNSPVHSHTSIASIVWLCGDITYVSWPFFYLIFLSMCCQDTAHVFVLLVSQRR